MQHCGEVVHRTGNCAVFTWTVAHRAGNRLVTREAELGTQATVG
jgi:hypothetical protein